MKKLFILFLIKINKLVLNPGDILVINIPKDDIPLKDHQVLLDRLATYIPSNQIILFVGDVKLSVIGSKENE